MISAKPQNLYNPLKNRGELLTLKNALNVLYQMNGEFEKPKAEVDGKSVTIIFKIVPYEENLGAKIFYNFPSLIEDLKEFFKPWLGKDGVELLEYVTGSYIQRTYLKIRIHIQPKENDGYNLQKVLTYQFPEPVIS